MVAKALKTSNKNRPIQTSLKPANISGKKMASTETKPIIFSFFSGAGFLDLGFEKAGYEIGYVSEIHKPFMDAYKYARGKMGKQ